MIYLGKDPVGIAIPENKLITNSGIVYIDTATTFITVNHSLGGLPDFAYICIDLKDSNLIPLGCCVSCAYGAILPEGFQNVSYNHEIKYVYSYKHPTSGNLLIGSYGLFSNQLSDTEFIFARGNQNWQPNDTNGNPMPYRWIVGRFV